jgi:hypothetical protein
VIVLEESANRARRCGVHLSMNHNHNHNMFRTMAACGIAAAASLTVAVGAIASPAAAATATSQHVVNPAPPVASQQGIIMSDGRICNPRWGC